MIRECTYCGDHKPFDSREVCDRCEAGERDYHTIKALRAEVETLKQERDEAERLAVSRLDFANESFRKSAEYAVKLDMLTHEHKLAIAEADRYRAALEEIVDRATIETAPAATIARKALEGYAK